MFSFHTDVPVAIRNHEPHEEGQQLYENFEQVHRKKKQKKQKEQKKQKKQKKQKEQTRPMEQSDEDQDQEKVLSDEMYKNEGADLYECHEMVNTSHENIYKNNSAVHLEEEETEDDYEECVNELQTCAGDDMDIYEEGIYQNF